MGCSKDPADAVVNVLCVVTLLFCTVIYYGDTPCAGTLFLGLAGIVPLKDGFTARSNMEGGGGM